MGSKRTTLRKYGVLIYHDYVTCCSPSARSTLPLLIISNDVCLVTVSAGTSQHSDQVVCGP